MHEKNFFGGNLLRKKCPYSDFFWSVFSRIRTEYEENTDHKNSEYGHFLRSDYDIINYKSIIFLLKRMWIIFVLYAYCSKKFANVMVLSIFPETDFFVTSWEWFVISTSNMVA